MLGYVAAAQGDAEGALEHYRHAIALDDSFVEAMLNAAELLIHPLHDFDAAVDLVDEALEWTEGSDEVADALLLKFDAYMHQNDREAAKKVLRTLPDGEFETPRLEFLVGRAYFEVGELATAREYLERARAREPEAAGHRLLPGPAVRCPGRSRRRHARVPALPRARRRRAARALERVAGAVRAAGAQGGRAPRARASRPRSTARWSWSRTCPAPRSSPTVSIRARRCCSTPSRERDGRPHAGRVFVYQRNVERMCEGPGKLEDDLRAPRQ